MLGFPDMLKERSRKNANVSIYIALMSDSSAFNTTASLALLDVKSLYARIIYAFAVVGQMGAALGPSN
jgi:hypothetical protein